MTARKVLPVFVVVAAVVFLAWWVRRIYSAPPEVPFARVKRETLVSTLNTNGKVEPFEWVSVRAEREGVVERVNGRQGQRVGRGALLVDLDARDARAALASAEARIAQARAEIEALKQGGRAADLAEIENELTRARMDLKGAQRDHESLRRLAEKQAATRQEVVEALERMEQARAQIKGLEAKRAALVSQPELAAAEARLREAQAAREQALERIEQSALRAPMSGVVYELKVRVGAYLHPGDLVANIGRLERVRVRVYVDEPELGRVAVGMPVTITWDALPGRKWQGAVERMPTRIESLETRQVGEVICTIENPGLELLAGTNVNAEIRTRVVENGLILPKEAVRREEGQAGVYVLQAGERVGWRRVHLGVSSLTRTQVIEGVSEGDAVALTAGAPVRDGERVRAVFPY